MLDWFLSNVKSEISHIMEVYLSISPLISLFNVGFDHGSHDGYPSSRTKSRCNNLVEMNGYRIWGDAWEIGAVFYSLNCAFALWPSSHKGVTFTKHLK
jgi:hypothetical protein